MKLVRNLIPDVVDAKGETEPFRLVTDDAEHDALLDDKLTEELGEWRESGSLIELADLLAVARDIAARAGCSWDDLLAMEADKRDVYGGFNDGVVWLGDQNRPYDRKAAS